MKHVVGIICIVTTSSLIIFISCFKSQVTSVTIAKWKNDATAAYSIFHDDLGNAEECHGIYEHADTIAYNRGLKFCAGAIVKCCVDEGEYMWEHLKTLTSHGHEIAAHSWDHGSPVDLGWQPESWSVDTDVVMAKQVLEKNVPGTEVNFFIFPFDAYNNQRINEVKEHGYLGARVGKKMYDNDRGVVTSLADYDPFSSNFFDTYFAKEEQDAIDAQPDPYTISIYNDDKDDVEMQHVDSAISSGGWSIQAMHSVDNTNPWGWGHISINKYRALLDYVKKKVDAGILWMDTPSAIMKYLVTKNQSGDAVLNGNVISFSNPEKIDPTYATEVTLIIKTSWFTKELSGIQGKTTIVAKKVGNNNFMMDINPLNGNVTIAIK